MTERSRVHAKINPFLVWMGSICFSAVVLSFKQSYRNCPAFLALLVSFFIANGEAAEPLLLLDAGVAERLEVKDGRVAEWRSVVGSYKASQGDAGQRPAIGPKLNGRNTLTFDGDDYLEGAAALTEGDDTFTFIAVWRPHRAEVQVVFEQAGDGGGRRAALLQVREGYGFNGEGNDAHSLAPAPPNQWRLSALVVNGGSIENVMLIDNGQAPLYGSIDIDRQNVGLKATRIGNKLTSNNEFLKGEIAEIQVYGEALVLKDLKPMLEGLKKKWGLDFNAAALAKAAPKKVQEPAKNKVTQFITELTPDQVDFFETHVRPTLAEHCYSCHSGRAEKLKAGLYLDSAAGIARGGESGAIIVPGDAEKSLLIKAVRYQAEDLEMPPKKKLPENLVNYLVDWINMGAPWPKGDGGELAEQKPPYDWEKFRREHWSFRPVKKSDPPKVESTDWIRNPIDQFIIARLEEDGLKPAPEADRRTLLRRVYLDLIGVPPTPDQIVSFLKDDAADAFDKVVDELLKSPHYGERWGRHWLDVARYSDGLGGFLDNSALPHAWRYRDWVVEALNADLPYDEFVKAQIAGDLINPEQHARATGFFAVGPTYNSDGGDPEAQAQAQAETLGDRVDTFSRAFLGLTAACARCHDHKFDPITVKDYYSIAGIFRNSRVVESPVASREIVEAYDAAQKLIREQDEAIKNWRKTKAKELNVKENEVEGKLAEPLKKELADMKAELEKRKNSSPPKYPVAHCLADSGSGDMHVAIRGDLRKKGEMAPRKFLQILAGEERPHFKEGSGRLQLAEAVADPKNPLTARVLVNRIWQLHFGEALVRSPSNFGVIGEKPTHPELLDWLAATFVEDGWSLKKLHRLIVTSATWRMGSDHIAANMEVDAGNFGVWRMNPRKLDVEAWRDSLLAVTGELDVTIGGAPTEKILESRRRTLYAKVSRNGDRFRSDEFLRMFDFPTPRSTSPKRAASTVPQQYLFMMNSPFMIQRANALVERLSREGGADDKRIEMAYRLLYSRDPSAEERDLGIAFLSAPEQDKSQGISKWQQYAQVLLSAHEFIQIQ